MFNDSQVDSTAVDNDIAATVARMERLYDQGKLLQAYRLGEPWGQPTQWPGSAAVIGGRILNNLGAPRLGSLLHYRAFRNDPGNLQAIYYCNYSILERRGPLAAIEFWETHHPRANPDDETYPDWLAMRGSLACIYRDFETAEEYLTRAERLAPDRTWLLIERSRLLEGQDQFDAALRSARRSLEIHPWFRSGVHHVAHLLQVLDRDAEALEFLEQAAEQIESALILQQLAALQDHLQLHDRAMRSIDRIEPVCPVREKRFMQNIEILRSNVAYHAGDFTKAADAAVASAHPFMLKVAEKLRSQETDSSKQHRVLLEFPFVRQHYMTCAPATVAAVGRFFNKPTEHLSVVDAICYDGTPAYSQRLWAQRNGWIAREFTVSWDAAVALIDRQIPFMLATTQVTNGHLQAVIGYDRMRGTLLCRDPYQYHVTEFHAEMLLEQQAASGPRAMVIVPEDKAHLLDGLDLPDAHLYDHLHEVERSLSRHDRSSATDAMNRLMQAAPEHRLTFQSQRALGNYDRDSTASLSAVESLLKLYPKDAPLLFVKALLLRSLDRSDLLTPLLADLCGNHLVDACFLHLRAEQIQRETADRKLAIKLLRRALRRQPTHGQSLIEMGHHLWAQRKLEKATLLYQLAASVDSMKEGPVQTYFAASRFLKKTESALSLLKKRSERLIARSSQPVQTYFWALESLDRTTEAFAVLSQAREKRPNDGDLFLYAADAYGRRADFILARQLLESASGKTHQSQWLRTAAHLCAYEGDLQGSLKIWNQLLDAEPLAADANREVASLLARTQSPDAATKHLARMMERFPFNTELAQLQISWLRSSGHSAVASAAAALVARQPANVRALVELSLSLAELGKADEALEHALRAVEISPDSTSAHYAQGNALERMLKLDEAREAYRNAIRISVDYPFAVSRYVDSYPSIEQKRDALAFVHQELMRQVVFGESLLTYRREANTVIEPAELLSTLQLAREVRPDLWQSWSAEVYQLSAMGRLDDAMKTAREAVDRFPLLPRTWYDVSYVAGLQADRPGKITALIQCLALSPGWSFAARQLADTYRLEGNDTEALAVLQRAVHRDPLDASNHIAFAEQLWAARRKDEAITHAKKAVGLAPGLSEAWQSLQGWFRELGKEGELVDLAREICRQRAGESVAWLILARVLRGRETLDERLRATDAAIALMPLDVGAHDQKVSLLMEQGRTEAAIAACDPPQFEGRPPVELLGRRAWIHAQNKDLPRAITEMRQIIETNKNYHWGWMQLLTWLSRQKSPEEYLAASEAMVRQFPHDAVARNHLSSAQVQNKDSKSAKQTLIAAVNAAPDNGFALNKLFEAQMKDDELTAAAQTLKLIERHMTAPEFLCRQVALATAQKDLPTATTALGKLCTAGAFDANALARAVKSMDNAKLQKSVNDVLHKAGTAEEPVPGVVEFWMQRASGSKQWSSCKKILGLYEPTSAAWLPAALVYVDGLTKARQYAVLDRFIRTQQKRTDLQTRLWGQIGYSIFVRGQSRRTIRFLSDWTARADAAPWMLLNLAHAYRRTNQFDRAHTVQEAAVQMPADHTTLKHQVWLALDEVLAGSAGKQTIAVTNADTSKLDRHYPYLLNLIRALRPLCVPEGDRSPSDAKTARRAISAAAKKVPGWATQRELRLAQRRATARVVKANPSLPNRVWHLTWLLRTAVVVKK